MTVIKIKEIRMEWLLVALFLVCYLYAGLYGIRAHQDTTEMDTVAYLDAALKVNQTGGILKHIPNCLSGVYREATQHPLYLLVLSPFAEASINFFVRAKIVSFCIGFLFTILFYVVVRKIFGVRTALGAFCLLLLNATFIHLSTMVACECLLAFFFLLFWYFAAKGFARPVYWLAAGLFAGLAFLTKSLGILSLPIFFIAGLVIFYRKPLALLRNRYFWGFFLIFCVVASPLFIRNARVYGTPLYSNSSEVLWLDAWRDYFRVDKSPETSGLGGYLRTHSPGKILKTLTEGFADRDVKMTVDGLKPLPFWQNPIKSDLVSGFYSRTVSWQGSWAFFLVACCLVALWRRRTEAASILAATALFIFFLFVGWYSKVFPGLPPTRLLYPVLFFILIYGADTVVWLIGKGIKRPIALKTGAVLACLLLGSGYLFGMTARTEGRQTPISRSYSFNKIFLTQLQWVLTNANTPQKMVVGDIFSSNVFYFRTYLKGEFIAWPKFRSMDELKVFLEAQRPHYGFLDLATVAYNTEVYGEYFMVGPKIGLVEKKPLPAFFKKIPLHSNIERIYQVYEFSF